MYLGDIEFNNICYIILIFTLKIKTLNLLNTFLVNVIYFLYKFTKTNFFKNQVFKNKYSQCPGIIFGFSTLGQFASGR